jgi:hypothetical protein
MSSLLDLLSDHVQSGGLSQIADQLGTDQATARKAVPAALGTLMSALGKNASQGEGAQELFGALSSDHDGSVLDDLTGALANHEGLSGAGILKHVLGGKRQSVESGLGQALSLDAGSAGKLLTMLAPLVMGALGKAQRQGGLDAGGVADLLKQERQQVSKRLSGFGLVSDLLDKDGDGQIADDVMGMVGSGLLKNLFKK